MALPSSGPLSIGDIVNEVKYGGPFVVTSISNSLNGPSGLEQLLNGSWDDIYIGISLPWSIYFNGVAYRTAYVGSNSYITFGGGSTEYSGLGADVPPLPAIMISSADRSYQRIYAGSVDGNQSYIIRFEGSQGTSGTPGSPNLVWEITFYPNSPNFTIQTGELAGGTGGLKTSTTWLNQNTVFTTSNAGADITFPLTKPNVSLKSLSDGTYVPINQYSTYKPNGSSPYSVSKWYGYNSASYPAGTSTTASISSISDDGNYIYCQVYSGGLSAVDIETFTVIVVYYDNNLGDYTSGIINASVYPGDSYADAEPFSMGPSGGFLDTSAIYYINPSIDSAGNAWYI